MDPSTATGDYGAARSGDGVDGFVIRAQFEQEAETMAADCTRPMGYAWRAIPLPANGAKRIIFGAERACWELD